MNRERLIQALINIVTIAAAVIAARFGIPIPTPPVPPEQPPIVIPPPPPVPPVPPSPPEPKPDPANAIVRLSLPGVGCSATVIGPRRPDGRWWVLTAAHCVSRVGQAGTIRFLDGRVTGVSVASFDKRADACWMVTDSVHDTFPFAYLAKASPPTGTKIWHAGYGVDRPGNREEGQVLSGPDSNGQIRMRISVSSGDSGGGIVVTDAGEIVSCVCCTAARGQVADVWGASPEAIERTRPTAMVMDDWTPLEIPLRMPPDK